MNSSLLTFSSYLQIEEVRLRLNVDVTVDVDALPAPAPIESFADMVNLRYRDCNIVFSQLHCRNR